MPRILLFLAWPLIEIGLFVVIGGEIGLWPTLAWVVLTAVAGIVILRRAVAQGAGLLRGGLNGGAISADAPVTGLMRGLAAVLLILPGFLTDALGLLLLLPPVQTLMRASVMARLGARVSAGGTSAFTAAPGRSAGPRNRTPPSAADDMIDGEWVELPPELSPGEKRNRPSRWTETD